MIFFKKSLVLKLLSFLAFVPKYQKVGLKVKTESVKKNKTDTVHPQQIAIISSESVCADLTFDRLNI